MQILFMPNLQAALTASKPPTESNFPGEQAPDVNKQEPVYSPKELQAHLVLLCFVLLHFADIVLLTN